MEGGWQNNRGGAVHQKIRFVENIFEELDAPGEWFLDTKTHTLYFYPPTGLDLARATVEATRLRSLVEFRGGEDTARALRRTPRPHLPPRGAHGDGYPGTADAFGLGDLSRWRDSLRRARKTAWSRTASWIRSAATHFRQPLQPAGHRARLPDRQGGRQRDLFCGRPAGDAQSIVQLQTN
jgi:hypothetical protein